MELGSAMTDPVRLNGAGIGHRVADVESRMTKVEDGHKAIHDLLDTLLARLGEAHNEAGHPTGLYSVIHEVSQRLTWFERVRENVRGAAWATAILVPIGGALTWFLAGDKITWLFGG